MSDQVTRHNVVVAIVGRGRHTCGMVTGDIQDIANRCQHSVTQGFEVYLYTIEPNPLGADVNLPPSVMPLRRVYHLYDATEKYADEAHSIIESLDAHSIVAAKKYLSVMVEAFNRELAKLAELEDVPSVNEPTTGT